MERLARILRGAVMVQFLRTEPVICLTHAVSRSDCECKQFLTN